MKICTFLAALLALCNWSFVMSGKAMAHGGTDLAVLDCEDEDGDRSERTLRLRRRRRRRSRAHVSIAKMKTATTPSAILDCEDEDGDDDGAPCSIATTTTTMTSGDQMRRG